MARNMDFVRLLLLDIESHPPGELADYGKSSAVADRPSEVVIEHLMLLMDARFIAVEERDNQWGRDNWRGVRLTWAGTEFLDDIRHDKAWERAKEQVVSKAGSVAMAVVAEVARGVTRGIMSL